MSITHLYSNESYDESESWCNPGEPCTPDVDAEGTRDPGLATCTRCLSAAASYGDKARSRMMELQSAEGVRERRPRAPRGRAVSSWQGRTMIDPAGLSAFQRIVDQELAAARRRADENDQRMLDALQGKPFWRRGPAVEVTGFAKFIPSPDHYDNVKPGVGRGDE